MTTLTIHADDEFACALRAYASRIGKSVNQAVKDFLAPILGLNSKSADTKRSNPWEKFIGCVSKEETDAIRASVNEQHIFVMEMW